MAREYGEYLDQVRDLKLPEYFDEQKREAAEALGSWVLTKPTEFDRYEARKYLKSFIKRDVDKTFGVILRKMATPVANILAGEMQRLDKPDPGILDISVGFSETGKKYSARKIRTLKSGTREKMESESPFLGPMYQSGSDYLKELRVHSPLSWILRTGFDEILQFGKLPLISPRGYLSFELRSRRILKALSGIKELGFSQEQQDIIKKHEGIMVTQGVVPGIINPLSAVSDDGGHPIALSRFYLDEQYAELAFLPIDIGIGISAVARRSRQLVSVVHAVSQGALMKAASRFNV